MSFYPILTAPGCTGWTTVHNYPPNNWEVRGSTERELTVTWAEGSKWISKYIDTIPPNSSRTVLEEELSPGSAAGSLLLVSLSETPLPATSDTLPVPKCPATSFPAWRATLGLSTQLATTSYQGEIDPFPDNGSLLTFGPFMQFGEGIGNILLIVNIQKSAQLKQSEVEIFDARSKVLRGVFPCYTNSITPIPLDGLGFTENDLPLAICRSMSAIPIYLSKSADGSQLSMEHTHPPASFVIRGDRWGVQRILKNKWFGETKADE